MGVVYGKVKCKAAEDGIRTSECKKRFRPSRRDAVFCCDHCRWAWHNEQRAIKGRAEKSDQAIAG
jgi:hypothetical protein